MLCWYKVGSPSERGSSGVTGLPSAPGLCFPKADSEAHPNQPRAHHRPARCCCVSKHLLPGMSTKDLEVMEETCDRSLKAGRSVVGSINFLLTAMDLVSAGI